VKKDLLENLSVLILAMDDSMGVIKVSEKAQFNYEY